MWNVVNLFPSVAGVSCNGKHDARNVNKKQAKERGESEGCFVWPLERPLMKQIQVEPAAATATTLHDRESGQTSARPSAARAHGEPPNEGTQWPLKGPLMTGTGKPVTGAPSDIEDWHAIDKWPAAGPWKAIHTNVKRLQARMAPRRATFAKAAQAGKRGKVKALQKWPF